MTEYQLPFAHELISFDYINIRPRLRDTIVANPDLKEVASILMAVKGFGRICNQDLLAEAMYEYVIATERSPIAGRKNPDRKTKGIFRLENVLAGGAKISVKEAEVLWKALRHAFGPAPAAKFSPASLARMSVLEFKQRLLAATAVLPVLSNPELRLQMLAAMITERGLKVRPSFANVQRVGAVPGSLLAAAPSLGAANEVAPNSAFSIEVDGLKSGENLIVIEAAQDPIVLSETFKPQLFPAGALKAKLDVATIKPKDSEFVVGQAPGLFTYFAVTGDLSNMAMPLCRFETATDPFLPRECDSLIDDLFTSVVAQPDKMRMACFSYRVR